MYLLEGFVSKGYKCKVYQLKHSIYGLKQSCRQWYLQFHQAILQFGFMMVKKDYCVYLKRSNYKFLIMTLYVDNVLMAYNDLEMIAATKGWLASNFVMKDIVDASYVLGEKIYRN